MSVSNSIRRGGSSAVTVPRATAVLPSSSVFCQVSTTVPPSVGSSSVRASHLAISPGSLMARHTRSTGWSSGRSKRMTC